MSGTFSRRELLGAALTLPAFAARAKGVVIDTHIHLFDPARFPYHPNGTYKPPAQPLEPYAKFVRQAGIAHTIIVHPEPYQDDHRYLEYCFQHEPSPGYFKGTCLFDPIAAETPARMEALAKKLPGRIVALRIHATQDGKLPPTQSGPIRDRDLRDPRLKAVWRKAGELGLAIQMHMTPFYAPQVDALCAEFPNVAVVIDHLARAGQGTPAEFENVLKLGKRPRTFMKYSALNYSSKQKYPFKDAWPVVRRCYDAFGPDRMIWGGLGHAMPEFEQQAALFEMVFDFAPESERAKIRGLNAKKLYGFAG